jgi:predicted PolB exonuclease-like 3'-5' exonuclease
MSQQEAAGLVEYLATQVGRGYTLVTWNGTGFDLDILAEESGMLAQCRRLAVDHVDMMFHVLCQLGYGVGLDAAARGMNLAGKPEGMSGAVAPVLWAEGRREEVLAYVAQDVRTTLELARACEAGGLFAGSLAVARRAEWHCRRHGCRWIWRNSSPNPILPG